MSFVQVGILHSLCGTMAISEAPLVEAELMAISQINQTGGVLGQIVEPIIADGASDPNEFASQARKLTQHNSITTVFGCWTSASRKAVLPVLEESNAVLWYPVQYEGLECSQNIFYTGSCPNQQVEPAVTWLLENKGRRFYLLGSDYVFPRTVGKIIKAQLKYQGGTVVGEEYTPLGTQKFADVIARIKQTKPDVVFNTLSGDSNLAFYCQYQKAGIIASEIPILTVSIAESEFQQIGEAAVGHYASRGYFQSVDTPNNRRFVENFRQRYGADRVTSDAIASAYTQVYLWKQAVEAAQSFEVERVRVAAYGQSFEAPSGLVQIEPNHHVGRTCRIGKILPTGQFEIVHTDEHLIKPLPWLGVEQADFNTAKVVIEMLAEVSQGIHQAWQLEQKSRESTAAKVQLQQEIMQRQRVEAVLSDSQAQLQALFAAMTDVVLVIDAQGRYLQVAPTNPALLYKPAEQLIGKTLHEVFEQEQADTFIDHIRKAIDTHQTVNIEYNRLTNQGQEVWLDASISPLSENSVIWVARDITGRKQTEDALYRSEQQYRLVVDNLKEVVFQTDASGLWTFLNPAWTEVTGFSVEESLDTLAVNYIHPDDRQRHLELFEPLIQRQQEYCRHELRYLTKNGGFRWVEVFARLTLALDSTIIGTCGTLSDITDRRLAEEKRRQAEERYHSIFENSDEGLFQAVPDGGYLSANPALARIYGYKSPEELIATLTNINQTYVDKRRRTAFLTILHSDDSVTNFESQVYRKDGSIIWISENTHIVRDELGLLLYYEGSVVDVTVRKVWEEALRYEQECAEELLLNILPEPVAQRLKLGESTIADSFAEVTVLFADLVDFTEFSAQIPPTKLLDLLNKIFSEFDQLAQKHGLEKIKTIGDAYMVVGGLPKPMPDHAAAIAEMALDMQQQITRFKRDDGTPFSLRIGIHTGPVVAGVIGIKKFIYDLWGDTVNVASRMESQGVPGSIQVTATTHELLKDNYLFESRGATFVKGKGEMITYWLTGRKVCPL